LRDAIGGQKTNQTALFEIAGDQKSRRQRDTDTLQGGLPQDIAGIGDQIAGRHADAGVLFRSAKSQSSPYG
jgi:hypothetical protein